MKDDYSLESNSTDAFVFLAKSISGGIPLVGSFISEVIGLVPNQRQDRICKQLKVLEERIEELERNNKISKDQFKFEIAEDSNMLRLFEKTISSSSMDSQEKYQYYSEFIINSILKKEIELIQKERILSILTELNENEVILLIYENLFIHLNEKNDFFEKHKDIILPRQASTGDSIEKQYPYGFHEQYYKNLTRLGVLYNSKTEEKEFNQGNYKPTIVGKLIFQFIGAEKYQNIW